MLDKINSFLNSTTGVVVWNLGSYVIAKAANSDTAWAPYRDKIEATLGVTTSDSTTTATATTSGTTSADTSTTSADSTESE